MAAEASRLVGVDFTSVLRYEPDGSTEIMALSGAPVELAAAVPITLQGELWGTLVVVGRERCLPSTQDRLSRFADLVGTAIAAAESRELLTASRDRVASAADETRRRLQRDLHDGAQQRLVQTIITLKVARDRAASGKAVGEEISEALYHAERANAELRDLVHGILPAALTEGGLRTGLESFLDDVAIPVDLDVTVSRLSAEIETTAYFIVAEALTNVVKHARATRARIGVDSHPGTLVIDVADDGIGGADASAGGGLTGLADRVGAANGILTVTSIPDVGTTVHASLPLTGGQR